MRPLKGIIFFGFTEIAIGMATLEAIITTLITHTSTKPQNVLTFVAISSLISTSLGIGVLLRSHYFRKLIMFFSGWIILSKVLIFGGIITLNGALETAIAPLFKNIISIIYHLAIMLYFHQPQIKREFES